MPLIQTASCTSPRMILHANDPLISMHPSNVASKVYPKSQKNLHQAAILIWTGQLVKVRLSASSRNRLTITFEVSLNAETILHAMFLPFTKIQISGNQQISKCNTNRTLTTEVEWLVKKNTKKLGDQQIWKIILKSIQY